MTGNERVRAVITGKSFDRQPIYGWLYGNLTTEIDDRWGSLSDLEDKYEFDIDLISDRYVVDAKSIMGIFSLDLTKVITVEAHTEDASEFAGELKPYIVE